MSRPGKRRQRKRVKGPNIALSRTWRKTRKSQVHEVAIEPPSLPPHYIRTVLQRGERTETGVAEDNEGGGEGIIGLSTRVSSKTNDHKLN